MINFVGFLCKIRYSLTTELANEPRTRGNCCRNNCLNRKYGLWSPNRANIESMNSEGLESSNPVNPNNEDARS